MNIADLIQTALLIVVILQLWSSHNAYLADHERRKKQATFEFVNAVSERFRSALKRFDEKHGVDKIVDISDYDDDDRYTVRSYLSEIERICAGVNSEVFDFYILKKMMGGTLQVRHHRFEQYIREAQQIRSNLYCEFDEVVRRLEREAVSKYENVGKIVNS